MLIEGEQSQIPHVRLRQMYKNVKGKVYSVYPSSTLVVNNCIASWLVWLVYIQLLS
jgi:hypothetical protein